MTRKTVRAVIYVCKIGFSKLISEWSDITPPVIGEECSILVTKNTGWIVKMVNKIAPHDHDQIETFFFESDDEGLFDVLSNHVYGWVPVEQTQPVAPTIAES